MVPARGEGACVGSGHTARSAEDGLIGYAMGNDQDIHLLADPSADQESLALSCTTVTFHPSVATTR